MLRWHLAAGARWVSAGMAKYLLALSLQACVWERNDGHIVSCVGW